MKGKEQTKMRIFFLLLMLIIVDMSKTQTRRDK